MAVAAQNCKRRVMIAVDGSPEADNAFDYYLQHLKQPDDYVYGIIVPQYRFSGVSAIHLFGPLADVNAISADFKTQYDAVSKVVSDYTAKLRSAGVKGQVDQYPGDSPANTILDQCDVLKCDTIIMGTRGLGRVKKFLLGSCSNYVLHNASVPVTVVPLKDQQKKE